MRYLVAVLALLPALALADIAGPANVIDGDTIEISGQRIRLCAPAMSGERPR
jgi:endonuclease YncB( thermonuclease family)